MNEDNLLEDRNTKYDTMLNQMVGRIQAKPGGKPEMGEVRFSYNSLISKLYLSDSKALSNSNFTRSLELLFCYILNW